MTPNDINQIFFLINDFGNLCPGLVKIIVLNIISSTFDTK